MNRASQFFIVYAAVSWGLVGVWSRYLSAAGFSFSEMAAARCFITAVGLFAFLLFTNRELIKINIRDIWVFILDGGIGIALCFICYFITANTITLSATTILLYTAPYMVMILSAAIFKEKVTLQKIGALLIAFTGCVMTVGIIDNSVLPLGGILSGLSAALCYALYTIFGKIALHKKYTPITITAYSYGIASIILIPLCDMRAIAAVVSETGSSILYLLVFGIFFTLLPYLSYMKGLEKLDPGRASIIAFAEPLTAAVAGIAVYREMLTPIKMLGMALILISLFILNIKRGE